MIETIQELITNDKVVREIVNGIWFSLGLEIITCLNLYLIRTFWEPKRWITRIEVQMAIAWDMYMIGSSIRSGWVWRLLECQNRTLTECVEIRDNFEVLFIAAAFAVMGGLLTIACITKHWGKWVWIPAAAIAMLIPFIVHIYV